MIDNIDRVLSESKTEVSFAKSINSEVMHFRVDHPGTIPIPTSSRFVREVKEKQIKVIPLSDSF